MSYDWENIFKEKSNKELYSIYCGDSMLTDEAIWFAKQELERRHFDFKNLDAHRKGWRLISLIKEDNWETNQYNKSKTRMLSNKTYLVLSIFLLLFVFILCSRNFEKNFKTSLFLISMFLVSCLIDNITYKNYIKRRKKRIDKIKGIKEQLINQQLLDESSPIYQDIKKERLK